MDDIAVINTTITALLALSGASAGSFINAAALRRKEGISIAGGRSRCPVCGRTLKWFELIPVLSWFMLAGRCRTCKAKISPRYMLVEVVGAVATALCYLRFSLSWMTLVASGVAVILLAVAMFDLTVMEIPNGLVVALIPLAAGCFIVQPEITLLSRGIGLLIVSVPMLVLALVINGAFGGGDIKLMAVCGVMLGWQNTALAFFFSIVTAGCISLRLIAAGKAKKGAHIAFGPHLCAGVMAALLYGDTVIGWYLRLFGLN